MPPKVERYRKGKEFACISIIRFGGVVRVSLYGWPGGPEHFRVADAEGAKLIVGLLRLKLKVKGFEASHIHR